MESRVLISSYLQGILVSRATTFINLWYQYIEFKLVMGFEWQIAGSNPAPSSLEFNNFELTDLVETSSAASNHPTSK